MRETMKEREGERRRRERREREHGREEVVNSTTSDSHWNITTQRETSIRKNGLI